MGTLYIIFENQVHSWLPSKNPLYTKIYMSKNLCIHVYKDNNSSLHNFKKKLDKYWHIEFGKIMEGGTFERNKTEL